MLKSVRYYAGDEEFIYIGVQRLIEDMCLFADPLIREDLRWYLMGRFAGRGEVRCDSAELDAIMRRWELFAEALKERRLRHIPSYVRKEVFARDGLACVQCGATENLSLDHVEPFSRGGKHTTQNLRVFCRTCNSRKHAKTEAEWEAMRG